MSKYTKVVVGGTFDRLHTGHKSLLQLAFSVGENVVIGLTSDEFVKNKSWSKVIWNYQKRLSELKNYLGDSGFDGRYEIEQLSDIYGSSIEDGQIEAIVVSEQTIKGAEAVNKKRAERGLAPLPLEVAAMVRDQVKVHLSSTRIRRGQVSSAGDVYKIIFEKDIQLSGTQKQMLKIPMGKLVRNSEVGEFLEKYQPTQITVVGDVSLDFFVTNKLRCEIGMFDNQTERKNDVRINLKSLKAIKIQNQPGKIEAEAVKIVAAKINQLPSFFEVEGEEDLLVLPLLLLMPLGSLIFYGQPGEGMVVVEVNEVNKNRWYQFLR